MSLLLRYFRPISWLSRTEWTVKRCASIVTLSETHEMLQKTCRDFADNELVPVAGQLDEESRYPKEQVSLATSNRAKK